MPTYWAIHLPSRMFCLFVPLVYLWTGLSPFQSVDQWEFLSYAGPVLIANIMLISWIAPRAYFPILSDATNLYLAVRIVPTAFASIIKPFGEPFRVTPKGRIARAGGVDRGTFMFCVATFALTLGGLASNAFLPVPFIATAHDLPVAAGWAIVNCMIAAYAALIARERPRYRAQERFSLKLAAMSAVDSETRPCMVVDVSLSGAFVRFGNHGVPAIGSEIRLSMGMMGTARGRVVRQRGDGAGIQFEHLDSDARAALDRLLLNRFGTVSKPDRRSYRYRANLSAGCAVGSDWRRCTVVDASLSGAFISFSDGCAIPATGTRMSIDFPEVGLIDVTVVRPVGNGVGVLFESVLPATHDRLIRLLYTIPSSVGPVAQPSMANIVGLMGRAAFGPEAA